jgi:NADH:ubiquinone oxidoreductase subunit E
MGYGEKRINGVLIVCRSFLCSSRGHNALTSGTKKKLNCSTDKEVAPTVYSKKVRSCKGKSEHQRV